jgi:outer membrane protein
MKSIYKIAVLLLLLPAITVEGQTTGDSLSLPDIINKVIEQHPTVKKAGESVKSTEAGIGLAKSGYYPDISFSSSYSHLWPTSTITIANMGTFSFYPADNYSATLSVNQTLYDFGKTASNVSMEEERKKLAEKSVAQIKQQLSLTLAGNYYTLVFLQEALRIKDEELANLNEHLHFVEKKAATGSATEYEILTTNVRISNIENQKTDLQTSLQVQTCLLNSFLGQPENTVLKVRNELKVSQFFASTDSMIASALSHREEMAIAQQKSNLSNARYKMVQAQNNPALNFFATGGYKNGYTPELNTLKANYVVGVGLKVPVFDAYRTKYSQLQVKAERQSNDQDIELTRRDIVNDVVENRAKADAAQKKVCQSTLQLSQAQHAYKLAKTSFMAGAITNLDLLDSSTAVSESQLSLLKTNIDYTLSLLKLQIALGEQIYNVPLNQQ